MNRQKYISAGVLNDAGRTAVVNREKDSDTRREINGEGMAAVPGFIDSHEHIMGGGGEGGFHTRTPDVYFR